MSSSANTIRLENFRFKEQVNSKTVLFEEIPKEEPVVEEAPAPAAAANGEDGGEPSKKRQRPNRPDELLVSMELIPPVFDESKARGVISSILEKGAASAENSEAAFAGDQPKETHGNDRYQKHTIERCADATFELVYPAVGKDIMKKRAIPLFRVKETRELYDSVTFPRNVQPAEKWDKWVVEVLEGRKEQENVLYEDEKISLVKDYKWVDESNPDECKYLAIFKDLKVRSIRDLDGSEGSGHIQTLKMILEECGKKISEKHFTEDVLLKAAKAELDRKRGVKEGEERDGDAKMAGTEGEKKPEAEGDKPKPEDNIKPRAPPQLMFYLHYHPTFWYLHVHIVSTRHGMFEGEVGGEGLLLTAMDRFHKLEDVIRMLELKPDYYQKADLTTVVRGEKNAEMYGVKF